MKHKENLALYRLFWNDNMVQNDNQDNRPLGYANIFHWVLSYPMTS